MISSFFGENIEKNIKPVSVFQQCMLSIFTREHCSVFIIKNYNLVEIEPASPVM
jgi:hypothetical protein